MSNELAKQENTQIQESPKTFSDYLMERLTSVEEALPSGFNKVRFVQNSIALLNDNPAIAKYSKTQIVAGLLKASYLGLDVLSKECYLVPYGAQLNFQIDYRGAKKLAKKYSIRPIKDIYAEIVREGDEFEKIVDGNNTIVKFKPKPFSDAKVIGAFAVVEYADGGIHCDMMTLKELETTRSKSKASNSMAWKDFTNEMYRKTVLHRLCKHIEIDFENMTQLDLWNDSNAMDKNAGAEEIHDPFAESEVVVDGEATEIDG